MKSLLMSLVLLFCLGSMVFADTGSTKLFADGFELLKKDKYTEAIKKFETGLKSDPKNALGHYYLGEAYLGQGNKNKALIQFQKSLDIDSNSSVAESTRQKIELLSGKSKPATSATPQVTGAEKEKKPTESELVELLCTPSNCEHRFNFRAKDSCPAGFLQPFELIISHKDPNVTVRESEFEMRVNIYKADNDMTMEIIYSINRYSGSFEMRRTDSYKSLDVVDRHYTTGTCAPKATIQKQF